MSGDVPGSKAYLGTLQKVTTQRWQLLSSEEQARYAELAKDWSKNSPPKAIQAK
jgi:hypothetical protein